MTTHRTPAERRRATAAATAVARAQAHTRPEPEPDPPNAYITPAVAHAIRLRIEEQRHA